MKRKAAIRLRPFALLALLAAAAVAAAEPANDIVPVISGNGPDRRAAIGPLVMGQGAAAAREAFAARGIAPAVDTPVNLQFKGSLWQDASIAETLLTYHQDRLYKIVLVTTATRETAADVFAALEAVFEKAYGPANPPPPGTGTFGVAEWTQPFDGLLKLQIEWKEDPGGTSLSYLHRPLYAERIKAMLK